MRVLLISNESSTRCGIREFGRNKLKALQDAGIDVTYFDGHYETLYRTKKYLPDDAASYDIVHLNWHPQTINHYLPEHFPPELVLSVYVNDQLPWCWCPVWDRADVRFAPLEQEGAIRLIYPSPDYRPVAKPLSRRPLIGYSSVRGDGVPLLQQLCAKNGWILNAPSPEWMPVEQEIERLAFSTVNVAWYREGRGISGGVMILAAARRPLVINNSTMFEHLWGRDDLICDLDGDLEAAIKRGIAEQKIPRVADDYAWSTYGVPILLKGWEAALQARREKR